EAFGMHDGGTADQFIISIATVNLLAQVAEDRPLVITADDVHRLDEQTRNVLAFVSRRLDAPVVIVAAASSAHGRAGLGDGFRELRLDRLSDTNARELLAAHAADLDEEQREWVIGLAVGNPLALIELARSPAPTGTPDYGPIARGVSLSLTLERAFAGRLYDLPQITRDVVLVAAVASDASLPEILAATARMSGQSTSPTILEPAQALGLLSFDEKLVTFSHPLARAAVAQKESTSRRQSAHRALGAVITVNSYRRAWHRAFGTSTYDDTIADELEATTADSIRRGRTAAAIAALERSAQLGTVPADRGRRLVLAARLASRLGEPDIAVRLLDAAGHGELTGFDQIRAELLREDIEGTAIAHSGRVIQLCGVVRRAAAAGESELALELAYAAGRRRCAVPVSVRAQNELAAVAGSLARTSSDARAVAVLALADPIGHGPAVLSMLAEIEEDMVIDSGALSAYALAARAVGHQRSALKLFDRAELELRAHGLRGQLARNLCITADLRLDLGHWASATAALAEFATLSAASMSPSHRAAASATTAKAAALRGDTSAALQLVGEIEQSSAAQRGSSYLARAQTVRGIAYISAGQYLDANTALLRVFDPDDPSHHFFEQFGAVTYLAEAAVHAGRQDQARDVVRLMQLTANASGSPALLAQVAYAGAVLAPDDRAELLFLTGLSSDATNAPWPRARMQLAYGRWLRRQHRVTQSRAPLQSSLTTFQDLGAARWAEEALDELRATGVEGGQTLAATLLSAQEAKIARLAAHGLSNREIGQQLSISPRTVGSHLYRIFPKLGITTRAQLSFRLDEATVCTDTLSDTV
ncbi:MAG: ATP/maltotriose-dependent transcriptional regulator MalT, partial [Pseudonocardiales bacterium]|nr:ATP/maltotriose-dependent transcriptional regulator MalT [Pseudonocardiales bacterium]